MTLQKVSPFFIKKAITDCVGSAVQNIRKAEVGLLVETLNDKQGSRLLKRQKTGDIEGRHTSFHPEHNSLTHVRIHVSHSWFTVPMLVAFLSSSLLSIMKKFYL